MSESCRFIEIQVSAEEHAFTDDEFKVMLGLARSGIDDIISAQREAVAAAVS